MPKVNIKVQKTNDVSGLASTVNILIYGPAGIGKTTALAGCPSPIILSAEAGLLSLRDEEVPYVGIRNLDDLRDVYSWLVSSSEADQYQSVCIDSLSEICDQAFNECRKTEGKDPAQLYPAIRTKVLSLLSQFRSIPKHFVATAQELVKQLKGHDVDMIGPGVVGSRLSDSLAFVFDVVLHYTAKEGRRVVLTSSPNSVAKDRTTRLPKTIPNPKRKFLGEIIKLCASSGGRTEQ